MSMHEEFTAPVSRYGDTSPETIQYHIARARVLRSQAFSAHAASLGRFFTRLFHRHSEAAKNVSGASGYAANQS